MPAFRRAIVDVWGDAARDAVLARLTGEARDAFVRDAASESPWFPARHIIDWAFAVWEGPANRSRDAMATFVRRQWDLSFGVVRRTLLHLAAPAPLVARLPQLWKQDNVGGELEASLDAGGLGATLLLRDTPFVETPQGRASVAEIYRHAFSQTRAKDVTEHHALDGARQMMVRLRWKM